MNQVVYVFLVVASLIGSKGEVLEQNTKYVVDANPYLGMQLLKECAEQEQTGLDSFLDKKCSVQILELDVTTKQVKEVDGYELKYVE